MPRIRTIKPEFFLHEDLFDAEVETGLPLRVAFAGLWCHADREGRFKWRPRTLKAGILPFDECDFSRVLDALTTRGFVVRYASGTREYGCIPTFSRHQVVNNRERDSELPAPGEKAIDEALTRGARVGHASTTRGQSRKAEGKGREQEGKGRDMGARKRAKHSPQEAFARKLAEGLGASLNPCRKQVRALLAQGRTLDDLEAGLRYVMPGMAPWDWTKKVTGTDTKRQGLTPQQLMEASRRLREEER